MSKLLVPGINPLAYLGVNPVRPVNMWQYPRNPLPTDYQKYQLMDHWENILITSPDYKSVWILVAKNVSGVAQGVWVKIIGNGHGPIVSLTGNTGGAVFGDVNNNINTLGDVTTIIATGNPGTNTITFSTSGTGVMSALQPQINGVNNGAAVSPIAGVVAINNTDLNIVPSNGGTNHLNLNFANSIGVQNNITAGVSGSGTITEFDNNSSSILGGSINFDRQHGALGTIVVGDYMGQINWMGYDGSGGYTNGASIVGTVQTGTTVGVNRIAGQLQIFTHPDSTSGAMLRSTFNCDGSVNITGADTGSTNSTLAVGNGTGGTGVTLNLASTYNVPPPGGTTDIMIIDSAGNVGTSGGAYATGSFTPTLTFSTSTSGVTYSSQAGQYTQIGNTVNFILTIGVTSIGTSSGNMSVAGLPVIAGSFGTLAQDCPMEFSGTPFALTTGYTNTWGAVVGGSTTAEIFQGGSAQMAIRITEANISAGNWSITVNGFYFSS